MQEALLAATQQWPTEGVPDSPTAWLVTVASRRLVDEWRSDSARQSREETAVALETPTGEQPPDKDDTLTLLYLCCHPSLSVPSQLALTRRAVGGLTTAEIATAFLVPEATMAQRISRAKQSIKSTGLRFELPPNPQRDDRLRVVMQVLYLIFSEGYATSAGEALHRTDLTREAVRLTRMLVERLPRDGEAVGLLALMLLTDARRPARTTADGVRRLAPSPFTTQKSGPTAVAFTALRNGFYAYSAVMYLQRALETGELAVPEDGPVAWTAHADLAEAAALALTGNDLDGLTPR